MKKRHERQVALGNGDTLAWQSEPYRPAGAAFPALVGRDQQLRMITAAWRAGGNIPPFPPLLVGEPGVGKNRLVYELAASRGQELYIIQGHEDVAAEDLACSVRVKVNGSGGMEYVLSPLTTAMMRGGICFIDEIGKIRSRALSLLGSVLDERRYIDSTLLGERVHATPEFRFIAATNSGEVNALPGFIQSRMRPVIKVGLPEKADLNRIIERQFPQIQPQMDLLLDTFWTLWGELDRAEKAPSPRDAIHLFSLALRLGDLDQDASAVSFASNPSAGRGLNLEPAHLEEAFWQLHLEGAN